MSFLKTRLHDTDFRFSVGFGYAYHISHVKKNDPKIEGTDWLASSLNHQVKQHNNLEFHSQSHRN